MARTVLYLTADELLAKIPQADRDAATDDDADNEPDTGMMEGVIAQACDEVDSFYSIRGIPTPLDVAQYPLAKQAALYISIETLYTRRGEPAERSPHKGITDQMRKLLVKVADGTLSSGGAVPSGAAGSSPTAVQGDVILIESEPAMTYGGAGRILS